VTELQALAAEITQCTKCLLHRGRTKAVPGEGPANSEIMFIGEAPGFHEDQQGRPFVGAAGKFLEELLESIGLKRQDVYIANVIKCRPPGNRDPLPEEIEACEPYLDRQIELIQPRMVVTLGRFSMARAFPRARISSSTIRCTIRRPRCTNPACAAPSRSTCNIFPNCSSRRNTWPRRSFPPKRSS
jgi:uracil-DNA glycosylase family 4